MRIISGLQTVYRTTPPFGKARGNTVPQRLGLAYQRKVARAFRAMPYVLRVEEDQWFGFSDAAGGGLASPDVLVYTDTGALLIVEVKLSWTPAAVPQLYEFYLPILTRLQGTGDLNVERLAPLIITKNLSPGAPPAEFSIEKATTRRPSLLHWRGEGSLRW